MAVLLGTTTISADVRRARSKRSLVPPGLVSTRTPGASIAASESKRSWSGQRAIAALPVRTSGSEKNAVFCRSSVTEMPPMARSKRSAARSASSPPQVVGTSSSFTPSARPRFSAMSTSSPVNPPVALSSSENGR